MTVHLPLRCQRRRLLALAALTLTAIIVVSVCVTMWRDRSVAYSIEPTQGALVLTFDDMWVDDWYNLRPLFDEYDARATFFVCCFHRLVQKSQAQADDPMHTGPTTLEKLLTLQADGHEIAAHTSNHVSARLWQDPCYPADYDGDGTPDTCPGGTPPPGPPPPPANADLKKGWRYPHDRDRSAEGYVAAQVETELAEMAAYDIYPRTFAYPYGDDTVEADAKLLELFDFVRDVSGGANFPDTNRVFFRCGDDRLVAGVGIDFLAAQNRGGDDDARFAAAMDRAAEEDLNLIVYGHRTTPSNNGLYVTEERLRTLLDQAQERGLPIRPLSGVCAPPGDTDNDGCTDQAEKGSNPMQGGLRDPLNPWDFYDVVDASGNPPGDGIVDLFNDVFAVAERFDANDAGKTAEINRNSDPLTTAVPPAPAYHPLFDRGVELVGPNDWNLGPPDGIIDLFYDVFHVVDQFDHNCQAAP